MLACFPSNWLQFEYFCRLLPKTGQIWKKFGWIGSFGWKMYFYITKFSCLFMKWSPMYQMRLENKQNHQRYEFLPISVKPQLFSETRAGSVPYSPGRPVYTRECLCTLDPYIFSHFTPVKKGPKSQEAANFILLSLNTIRNALKYKKTKKNFFLKILDH